MSLTLALELAEAGQRIFPCDPATKKPYIKDQLNAATTDAAQIREWWRRWPKAMAGIPTARFWVLDFDVRPGSAPLADVIGPFASAVEEAGLVVETPGGGLHCYFARALGVAVAPRSSDIRQNVDTRGHDADGNARSYIIAPGSVRADGRRYQVVRGCFEDIAPAPLWLLKLAAFGKTERAIIKGDAVLRDALSEAPPDAWRQIFDDRQADHARRCAPRVLSTTCDGGYARQAADDLAQAAADLAIMRDGRKTALFKCACRVGRYTANGILSESVVTSALLSAWHSCGGARDHGESYALRSIADGLRYAQRDPLPPLARRYSDFGR